MDPLTLTIILSLFNPYVNITSQSSFQLLFYYYLFFLFVVYTINLPVVRPRSCRVIYYFDTPTLERRHQLFGRVTILGKYHLCWGLLVHLIKMFALVMDKGWCSWADPYHNILTRDEHKKYKIITKIDQFFKECSAIKNQARKILILYASICNN